MTTIRVRDIRHKCYVSIKMGKGDMYEIIRENISGKSVLDVSCVGAIKRAVPKNGNNYMHGFISRHAKYCIGVDLNERGVAKLNGLGYNCVVGDAENLAMGDKFEVIVAANLIEHLSNIGKFLESAKGHLSPEGSLIIATPNPFFLWRFIEIILKDNFAMNVEHTCWFDPKTLGCLLLQHGFHIKAMYWSTSYHVKPHSYFVRAARHIRGYFCSGITVVADIP